MNKKPLIVPALSIVFMYLFGIASHAAERGGLSFVFGLLSFTSMAISIATILPFLEKYYPHPDYKTVFRLTSPVFLCGIITVATTFFLDMPGLGISSIIITIVSGMFTIMSGWFAYSEWVNGED